MVSQLVSLLARLSMVTLPLVAATPATISTHCPLPWDDIKHLIVFGDSYTYIQGTYGYPACSFIGSYLPGELAFTPEQLLKNDIWQNYSSQSAGGPIWAEYLADCAVEDGLHSPLDCHVQLWDFASAGANTAEALLPLHHSFTVPLVNQTQQYLTYADAVLREYAGLETSTSLIAIWIGINDINDAYRLNLTSPSFYTTVISTIFAESITPLVDAGYTNFLLLNLPPLDRKSQSSLSKPLVDMWNGKFEQHTVDFAREHNVNAVVFDVNTLLNGVLDKPAHHGIKGTKGFCKGSKNWPEVIEDPGQFGCEFAVDEYFWFDNGHIGTRAHKALADGIKLWMKGRA